MVARVPYKPAADSFDRAEATFAGSDSTPMTCRPLALASSSVNWPSPQPRSRANPFVVSLSLMAFFATAANCAFLPNGAGSIFALMEFFFAGPEAKQYSAPVSVLAKSLPPAAANPCAVPSMSVDQTCRPLFRSIIATLSFPATIACWSATMMFAPKPARVAFVPGISARLLCLFPFRSSTSLSPHLKVESAVSEARTTPPGTAAKAPLPTLSTRAPDCRLKDIPRFRQKLSETTIRLPP